MVRLRLLGGRFTETLSFTLGRFGGGRPASYLGAIDTPRFNGVLKANTKASHSGKIVSLDAVPFLFFVLWDELIEEKLIQCRIWCVRPGEDFLFRTMAEKFFANPGAKNFQLHPPRNKTQHSNIIRNTFGTFEYPLYFSATRSRGDGAKYELKIHDKSALTRAIRVA